MEEQEARGDTNAVKLHSVSRIANGGMGPIEVVAIPSLLQSRP
jgi:hypothetical protein